MYLATSDPGVKYIAEGKGTEGNHPSAFHSVKKPFMKDSKLKMCILSVHYGFLVGRVKIFCMYYTEWGTHKRICIWSLAMWGDERFNPCLALKCTQRVSGDLLPPRTSSHNVYTIQRTHRVVVVTSSRGRRVHRRNEEQRSLTIRHPHRQSWFGFRARLFYTCVLDKDRRNPRGYIHTQSFLGLSLFHYQHLKSLVVLH